MDWRRWRELIRIHSELGTHKVLRDTVVSERLYLVDRLEWLVAVIERIGDAAEDRVMNLFAEDHE
jgi:hypothetical protein